jgi:decaprenylphospho-beta-D-ribofuranose 2-oxidase
MAHGQTDVRFGAQAREQAVTPTATTTLTSFDGGVRARCEISRPDRYRQLEFDGAPRIVRGGGYSYAAASFGSNTLVQQNAAFDRILGFDESAGILECEAGVTLGKLYDFLRGRGWFLPVQPGYPLITIGGCVAGDVHGKNHYRDGTFQRHVLSLRLFHPAHGVLELAPGAELFQLTCGGFGLTGHILSVRLQLQRFPATSLSLTCERIAGIADVDRAMSAQAERSPLLYTWHNFSVRGAGFGRGFVYGAEFTEGGGTPAPHFRAVDSGNRGRFRIQALNGWTIGSFNYAYETSQRLSPRTKKLELYDFLFPVANKVFYFELFGRRGFHEYQLIVPTARFAEAMDAIGERIARDRVGVTLASCKLFRGEQSLLRFDGSGICLAIDIPRNSGSERFLRFLDEVAIRTGSTPNILKDSRIARETVEATYPQYGEFRRRLHAFDPKRLYRSELSERLGL